MSLQTNCKPRLKPSKHLSNNVRGLYYLLLKRKDKLLIYFKTVALLKTK